MHVPRIQDYAVIGDSRSAALVSRSGSVDWLCWPSFESPSIFAALLDQERGGRFRVATVEPPTRTTRHYLDDSNVLVTELETPSGAVRLTDLMPVCSEEDKERRLVPEHELLRVVDCLWGSVELEARFEPRLDYARRAPKLTARGALGLRVEDGPHLYTLRSDEPLAMLDDSTATARFALQAGDRRRFSLTYDAHGSAVLPPLGPRADDAIESTAKFWRWWLARALYDGPYRAQVARSLLTLKLLAYAPSGAIVAAPTTSLPERLGGDLNWDYRFCWLRDASLTVRELVALGYSDEAKAFVDWLLHGTRLTRPRLSILYDVYGRLPGQEEMLGHLAGFAGSRPVRIRNAATNQLQLDTYGEVIDAVCQIYPEGSELDADTRKMLGQFGHYVCDNWQTRDHGIWEPRAVPEHHTHSRVLCWTALDRLIALARAGLLGRLPTARFEENRTLLERDIEEHSYSSKLQSYTQSQGGDTVDASLLLLGWYGFSSPSSPRMRSTFARIRERLECAPGLLYRYEESRIAGEGAFGICSFWAAEHLARGGGSLDEAVRWFESVLSYENDVGLFAEEIDPTTGDALGNMPQAFTHVGLISAALAIEERRQREAKSP